MYKLLINYKWFYYWLYRKNENQYENRFFDQIEDFIKYLKLIGLKEMEV